MRAYILKYKIWGPKKLPTKTGGEQKNMAVAYIYLEGVALADALPYHLRFIVSYHYNNEILFFYFWDFEIFLSI